MPAVEDRFRLGIGAVNDDHHLEVGVRLGSDARQCAHEEVRARARRNDGADARFGISGRGRWGRDVVLLGRNAADGGPILAGTACGNQTGRRNAVADISPPVPPNSICYASGRPPAAMELCPAAVLSARTTSPHAVFNPDDPSR